MLHKDEGTKKERIILANKKKVLMTTSTFPRWEKDTEPRFILDLAKAMNQLYDVTVLAPATAGAKDSEILEGVNVIRYHYLPVKRWETLCCPGSIIPRIKEKKARALEVPFLFFSLFLQLFIKRKQYDIIHAHWIIPQGIVQSFVGGRYIITGHGSDVTTLNRGLFKLLKQRCLDRAAHITVVSERLKQIIITQYHTSEDKISVVSMGSNLSLFSQKQRNNTVFHHKEEKIILFVGRFEEVKGLPYLIDAMEYVNASLYIVGSGPDESSLRIQANRFPDRITFLGSKSHEELSKIYSSADVCVVPSICDRNGKEEGFGLVILEAMASGVPIVASRSGGIVDIVRDGVNGLLAEPKNSKDLAEKINQILINPALAEQLKEEAYRTVGDYSYEKIAERFSRVYEIAENNNPGS